MSGRGLGGRGLGAGGARRATKWVTSTSERQDLVETTIKNINGKKDIYWDGLSSSEELLRVLITCQIPQSGLLAYFKREEDQDFVQGMLDSEWDSEYAMFVDQLGPPPPVPSIKLKLRKYPILIDVDEDDEVEQAQPQVPSVPLPTPPPTQSVGKSNPGLPQTLSSVPIQNISVPRTIMKGADPPLNAVPLGNQMAGTVQPKVHNAVRYVLEAQRIVREIVAASQLTMDKEHVQMLQSIDYVLTDVHGKLLQV